MSLAGVDEGLRWKHLDSASVFSPLLTFGSVEWASFKFPSCTLSLSGHSAAFLWFLLSSYLTVPLSLPAEPVRWWLLITDQRLLGLVNLPDDFCLDEHTVASRQQLTPTHPPAHTDHSIIDDGIDLYSWRSNRIVLWPPLFTCPHLFLCSYDK